MTTTLSAEQKTEWKRRICSQQESELSIAAWCRQNHIAVNQFYYWKEKLFPKDPLERTAFTELEDKIQANVQQSTDQIVLLDFQRIHVQIDPRMNISNMQQLIKELKELIC